VKVPRSEYQERQALTPAQARQFLDATRQYRLAALFSVALSLGLRQGEVLGLTWAEVDLDGGTITVRRQMQRVDGIFQFVETKSAQSRRVIDLPASLVPVLKQHRTQQIAARLAAGPAWHEWNLVFCTSTGAPFDGPNITRYCKRALADAGLPALTFHELRHSCASLLAAQRIPAHEIARLLGHSDVRLTLQRYTHAFDEGRRRVADAMDILLGSQAAVG
jgi:integrase